MAMLLEGSTVLITGGARRIGAALCRNLAAAGCNLAIHYNHSRGPALELAAELRQTGVRVWTLRGNLRAAGTPQRLIRQTLHKAGRLDILINNAAVFQKHSLPDSRAADARTQWEVNLLAPLLLIQAFANHCRQGHILNLLDTRIVSNRTGALPYSLAKKALAELTRLAALELAPHIAVNGIAPGPVLPADRPGVAREAAGVLPLQRRPAEDDVAAAALYLLQTNVVTGQIIFVDSGQHLLR